MIREQKVESVHQKDAHTQVGMILTPCSVNNCRLVCWCMFQRLCPRVQFLDHVHLGNFLRDSPICSVIVLFFFFFFFGVNDLSQDKGRSSVLEDNYTGRLP